MANLVLRRPQVTSEKEVVANERRFRVDDDVEGAVSEQLYATAFRVHPYRWPTIGWMRDIESFSIEDCRHFYRTYYAPNNAIVVLAGDIDEAKALRLIQQRYGALRPQRLPRESRVAEPAQRGERRLTMRRQTPTEKLQLGYHAPAGYRLLDTQTGATRLAPIRSGTVDIVVTDGAGVTRNLDDVAVTADGFATVDVGLGPVSVEVTDRFGNVGTFTL